MRGPEGPHRSPLPPPRLGRRGFDLGRQSEPGGGEPIRPGQGCPFVAYAVLTMMGEVRRCSRVPFDRCTFRGHSRTDTAPSCAPLPA
jgi:hypothetical protein